MRNFGIAAILLAAGCASSMSAEECLTADWRAVGYEDGARGASVSAVTPRRQICAKKASVTVDMAAYLAGRDEGLLEYCTPANGYAVGANGQTYYGACSNHGEDDFLTAYDAGKRLYELEYAVASIGREIQQAHQDLHEVERRIAQAEAGVVAPDTPHADRLLLLKDIRDLSKEKGRIETAIIALNRDQARAEERLAEYRDYLAYNGPYPQATMAEDASY